MEFCNEGKTNEYWYRVLRYEAVHLEGTPCRVIINTSGRGRLEAESEGGGFQQRRCVITTIIKYGGEGSLRTNLKTFNEREEC